MNLYIIIVMLQFYLIYNLFIFSIYNINLIFIKLKAKELTIFILNYSLNIVNNIFFFIINAQFKTLLIKYYNLYYITANKKKQFSLLKI
jgi:hypothetical protein